MRERDCEQNIKTTTRTVCTAIYARRNATLTISRARLVRPGQDQDCNKNPTVVYMHLRNEASTSSLAGRRALDRSSAAVGLASASVMSNHRITLADAQRRRANIRAACKRANVERKGGRCCSEGGVRWLGKEGLQDSSADPC